MSGATLGLDGKIALVTGGTKGLGRAIAHKLCSCGCRLILGYRQSDTDAKDALRSLEGLKGEATAVKGDVRSPQGLRQMLETVRRRHGRLDLFVHNAASWTPMAALQADRDALHDDIAMAIDPLVRSAAELAELMDGNGRIIVISSSGSHQVVPRYVSLGVAKAAQEALVRYLAAELAGQGIAVNTVSTAKLDKGPGTPNPEMARRLAARTPAGRLTRPEDVADVVALLCTDEAAWIQGQVINVDGGLGLCV